MRWDGIDRRRRRRQRSEISIYLAVIKSMCHLHSIHIHLASSRRRQTIGWLELPG